MGSLEAARPLAGLSSKAVSRAAVSSSSATRMPMVGESKLRRPSFMRKCSLQGKLELANAVSQSECATSDEARRIQQALENQLAAATNRTQSGVSNDFARMFGNG